jgi:hypothetical protein
MDEQTTMETNGYGGFLSFDDNVCLYQSDDGEIPSDISTC